MTGTDDRRHGIARNLRAGCLALALAVTDQQQEKLLAYLGLLAKWNQRYNLTAVADLQQAVHLHVLDSLSVLPYIRGPRVLDVGSGAGLPGIVLAVSRPDWQVYCVDSRGKKVRFIQQVVTEIGLTNVRPVHARIESWTPDQTFDTVICRAFAGLRQMLQLTAMHAANDGRWLAMKGKLPEAEMQTLDDKNYMVHAVHTINVPGLAAERHLVEIARRQDAANDR